MGQYYNVVIKNSEGKIFAFNRSVDGDYMPAKLMEHSWWYNEFVSTIVSMVACSPMQVAWVGDYSNDEEIVKTNNLYELAWGEKSEAKGVQRNETYLDGKYLVNHSKKIYFDCDDYKASCANGEWCIHPLPLLTTTGNGKGGGDYFGINKKDVGTWCWDLISVEDTPPEGYKEVSYLFEE